MAKYCRKCGLENPDKDELVTIYEGKKFCECNKDGTKIPNTLKICDCEHPVLSNKETIEYSEIKCDVCGKIKTTKKSGGCY